MPDSYSKNIVYLSKEQYQELSTNNSITVNGQTITFNEDDIYVTPQAEPITDVKINNVSIGSNGVVNIPYASDQNSGGIVRANDSYGIAYAGLGLLAIECADATLIKASTNGFHPIVPYFQHTAAFYGLAKAAGDATQSASSNAVGVYTDGAKIAIQNMLSVPSSTAIAPTEAAIAIAAHAIGDYFILNGQLCKATAAIAINDAITTSGVYANAEVIDVGSEMVHDVQINGTSIISNGVANIPVASTSGFGVIKIGGDFDYSGIQLDLSGYLKVAPASINVVKGGSNGYRPIVPSHQHESTFYGLATAAGDSTQSSSSNAVGTYTDSAKDAIQTMLGVNALIAGHDTATATAAHAAGDLFVMGGKLYKATAAIAIGDTITVGTNCALTNISSEMIKDVQVNGTSVLSNGIANVQVNNLKGITVDSNNKLTTSPAGDGAIKEGTDGYLPISPSRQHRATFYGLAKAAGDTTQSSSSNAVGTYTADAKAAIQSMLGVPGDVQINGTSIVSNGVANIPYAGVNAGTVKVPTNNSYGLQMYSDGSIAIAMAGSTDVKNGSGYYKPIVPNSQHQSVFYGLSKAAGVDLASETVTVGTYPATAKAAIHTMLGIDPTSIAALVEIPLVETVTGTTPSITGYPNTRYNCGEVSTITITPPSSGSIDVYFTSGSSAAVLTVPSTVKFPVWFDPTTLDTDTIYEIIITDGVYGSVMSWAS